MHSSHMFLNMCTFACKILSLAFIFPVHPILLCSFLQFSFHPQRTIERKKKQVRFAILLKSHTINTINPNAIRTILSDRSCVHILCRDERKSQKGHPFSFVPPPFFFPSSLSVVVATTGSVLPLPPLASLRPTTGQLRYIPACAHHFSQYECIMLVCVRVHFFVQYIRTFTYINHIHPCSHQHFIL